MKSTAQKATKKEQKTLKTPHLFAIVMFLIFAASILTYIVPAGAFDVDPNTNRIMGDTFHYVENTPVNLWRALKLIQPGMVGSAAICMNILFIGGMMGVFLATNAVDDVIKFSIYKLQDRGMVVLLPCCMLLMSLLGAFGGNDAFAAFTAVGIIFAKRLKLDPIIAVMAFYGASYIGFATGPNKIAKTAQLIADVPMFSGMAMRMIIWAVMTAIGIAYTMAYAKRISKDPSRSYMGNTDWYTEANNISNQSLDDDYKVEFSFKFVLTTVLFFGTFIFVAWGTVTNGWGLEYICATMTVTGLFSSVVIHRMKFDDICKAFVNGAASVAFIAIVIGLAKTISLILESGQILNTIIYTITVPLAQMSKGFATIMMYFFNSIFNFLIPSGSGQAAIIMPLMTPVADLLSIERQVAVSAFSLGDGLSNLIYPTVGVTMGALSMAKVAYDKWIKFILPLFLIWSVVSCGFLYVLAMVGWTGMGII